MKITIKDIARLSGYSPATVSKVIHNYSDIGEETKQKILQVMKETGYQPLETNRTARKQNVIGVVYAGKIASEFNHPFFGEVMDTFRKEIGTLGYDLLFFTNHRNSDGEENYVARCKDAQVEGCLIIGGDEVQQCIYDLDQSDIPCIGIDIKLTGKRSGYLMTDNNKIAKKVVEHLYLLGHREIAYIGGLDTSIVGQERRQGFIDAMNQFGLSIRQEWLGKGDYKVHSGYNVMKTFLAMKELPKAVFVVSDLTAFGAITAIKEHGLRVPEDIAVIGCDDIESSKYITPTLTTMRQDTEKIGTLAANMLSDIIKGLMESSSVMVEPELIIRESCGALSRGAREINQV